MRVKARWNPRREQPSSRGRLLLSGSILLAVAFLGPSPVIWSQLPPDAPRPAENIAPQSAQSSGLPQTSPTIAATVVSSAPGSIHGIVVSPDGSLYEGVRVNLHVDNANPGADLFATTDDSGRFSFSGVPPGHFTLTIAAAGFAPASLYAILHPGEDYDAQSISLTMSSTVSAVEVTASEHEIAEEQLRLEEQQRVLGIVPNFFVAYAADSAPLSPRQKFHLAIRSLIDPFTVLNTAAAAGIEQANNQFREYGQGTDGYAKRFGASYVDNINVTIIGSALMPSILHQDPRYFFQGTGTARSRIFHAIAYSVLCRSDRGHLQPNYSNWIADFATAGISNLYYPPSERGSVSLIFQNFAIGKATSAGQNLIQEFVVPHFIAHRPHPASRP
jgi:hypothetical protein